MMAVAFDQSLAIEGLGNDLLTEWGQWMRNDGDGRQSWSVKPRLDPGCHGTPPERVLFVDKLIARHRLKYHGQWSVVSRYYLSDLSVLQIALGMGREWPEARVKTVILAVCGMVEREYNDWRKTLDHNRGF